MHVVEVCCSRSLRLSQGSDWKHSVAAGGYKRKIAQHGHPIPLTCNGMMSRRSRYPMPPQRVALPMQLGRLVARSAVLRPPSSGVF